MKPKFKTFLDYAVIAGISALYALVYELFVFPNNFAPAGVNGIATMIQYLFQVNVGFLSMVFNIPLALWVYFKVDQKLALRSGVYVVVFSLCLILYDYLPLDQFRYETETGTSTILGPIVAGIFAGWAYSMFLRRGATGGGMDFVASIIRHYRPHMSLMNIIFVLNVVIACCSYVVYGFDLEPVLLCILYCYLTNAVSSHILRSSRKALQVEVITDRPEEMAQDIIRELGHSATAIPAKGMYQGVSHTILYVVVNPWQQYALEQIILRYPGSFAAMDEVCAVVGRFHRVRRDGSKQPAES